MFLLPLFFLRKWLPEARLFSLQFVFPAPLSSDSIRWLSLTPLVLTANSGHSKVQCSQYFLNWKATEMNNKDMPENKTYWSCHGWETLWTENHLPQHRHNSHISIPLLSAVTKRRQRQCCSRFHPAKEEKMSVVVAAPFTLYVKWSMRVACLW